MNDAIIYAFGLIASGLVTWGAIRQDIKNIHREIADVKNTANEAHKRIDDILLSEHK